MHDLTEFLMSAAYGEAYLKPGAAVSTATSEAAIQQERDREAFKAFGALVQKHSAHLMALPPDQIIAVILSLITLIFGGADSPLATFLKQLADVLLPMFS